MMHSKRSSCAPAAVFTVAALAAAALLLGARPAEARSYAFAELDNGVAIASDDTYGTIGYAGRLTVGLGGGWRGVPIRLYGFFGLGVTAQSKDYSSAYVSAEMSRVAATYIVGLRTALMPSRQMRLFFDVGGGYRHAKSEADVRHDQTYTQRDGEFLPILGGGLQYRLRKWLYMGIKAEAQFIAPLEEAEVPAVVSRQEPAKGRRWQTNVLFTVGVEW